MQIATQVQKLPYAIQSLARVPDSDAVIWRFMDFTKFFSILHNQALYFPVLSALNDVLEAAPSRLPRDAPILDHMRVWHRFQRQRHSAFVSCWHVAEDESAAMWALYAGESEGLAIQSTFGAASDAFGSSQPSSPEKTVCAGMVEYIDPDRELVPQVVTNSLLDSLKKRHWYAYERELRFIHIAPSNYSPPSSGSLSDTGNPVAPGIWVSCDLQKLIKAVVVSPSSPALLANSVQQARLQFGIDPSLQRRSRLCEGAQEPPDQEQWKKYMEDERKKHGGRNTITL